jgi:hypothetical protein
MSAKSRKPTRFELRLPQSFVMRLITGGEGSRTFPLTQKRRGG